MGKGEAPEILLLLCCVVTVIVFLCFSLGTVNLAAQAGLGRTDDHPERLRRLVQDLETTASAVTQRIRSRRAEIGRRTGDPNYLRDKLAALQARFDEILRRIQQVQAELAGLRQAEQDYEALQRTLKDLERQIDEQNQLIRALPVALDSATEEDVRRLRELLESLDKQIQAMRNRVAAEAEEPGTFNPRRHMAGDTTFTNPLIVECTKGAVTLQPEGRRIALSDLNSANPFVSAKGKYDGVFFVIRPDGFDAFRRAFQLAQESELRVMYEGVESTLKLKL